MENPYQALGLTEKATQDDIKNAYRKLAKKYHPDLNPGDKGAEAKFKSITQAYELIGMPEQRAKYDRGELGPEAMGQGQGFYGGARRGPFYSHTQQDGAGRYTYGFTGEGGEGFDEDLFASLFGAGRGRRKRAEGEDEFYQMEIDLKDSILGATREITLPHGKRLSITIPKGIASGTKLRFAGQGGAGIGGGPPGDAYVEIRVRPSETFAQQGNDLWMEIPVSLQEALLGGEVRVPTIDGAVMLKIPPRSNTGRKLRLAGKGAVDRSTKKRGDQIVSLKIVLPSQVDDELVAAVRDWSERHPYNPREESAA